jgi:hypothetical protein
MTSGRTIRVGIIAEDDSDVESAKVLLHRIAGRTNIGVKRFIGKGCGRVRRKCRSWALALHTKGCKYLILIHDKDRNNLEELKKDLSEAIAPSPITLHLICIPVEEIEAWWLADPAALKTAFNLRKLPKIKGHPQSISSPKELIGRLIGKYSQARVLYLNTKHNAKIAGHVNFKKLKSCDSFVPFYDFVRKNMA